MQFSKMIIDLYRVRNAGMDWRRVKRSRRKPERLLQNALQSPRNPLTLRLGAKGVRWIGREFQSADFFGIDENWNLVFVETKVSSQQDHLAHQLRRRVGRFVGMEFSHVDHYIFKYVSGERDDSFLMAHGARLRRLARKGRLQDARAVGKRLRRWIPARRPAKVRRVRFVAISQHLSRRFADELQRIRTNLRRRSKRHGSMSFSCVLLTPYLKNNEIAAARIDL